jgi:hypothetical protein
MDSIDKLLDALDKCRRNPAPSAQRVPIPSTFVSEAHGRHKEAKAELREALRVAVVEIVREDYSAGGSLRDVLRSDVLAEAGD